LSWNVPAFRRKVAALETHNGVGRHLLFEQFKENIGLAREFRQATRDGLRSAQAAWQKATPEKRSIWLVVPTVILVNAVAEHYSAPWYYEAAGMLVLIGLGWMLGAMLRRLS
jgi:hypothetical protein